MDKLNKINLATGYIDGDDDDKFDYFKHLPLDMLREEIKKLADVAQTSA